MLRSLIALVVLVLGGLPGSACAEPLNLLFFGNSFTMGGHIAPDVGRIAEADGHDAPRIVADLSGGKDLDYHIEQVAAHAEENILSPQLPEGETWDYVIMQGYSTEATHLGDPDDFVDDMHTLLTAVRDHPSGRGAGVTGILYQTWARGPSHRFYAEDKFENPPAMQAEVTASYDRALTSLQEQEGADAARLAPVGEAFKALGFDESLIYAKDHYHQNNTGALLSSLVLYRTIYGETVSDIPYERVAEWANVTPEVWATLVKTADGMAIGAAQ